MTQIFTSLQVQTLWGPPYLVKCDTSKLCSITITARPTKMWGKMANLNSLNEICMRPYLQVNRLCQHGD